MAASVRHIEPVPGSWALNLIERLAEAAHKTLCTTLAGQ